MARSDVSVIIAMVLAGAAPAFAGPIRTDARGEIIPATAPSFDCTRASSYVERAICADSLLGGLDRSIAWSYRRLLQHSRETAHAEIRAEQRRWLRVRDACANASCVQTALETRSAELGGQQSARDDALRAGLRRVGDCQRTRIDHIGDRFDVEPPMGTTVAFANGVWLVDYGRVGPVLASRLGDPARVCLVSIPRNCPRGDPRGRIYDVVNMRTGGGWRMPDAAHSCGGA